MCLASHNRFTTFNFHANSSQRFYAKPLSGFPMHAVNIVTTVATERARWNSMIVYADKKHGEPPPPAASYPPSGTW